jgi:tetratricopeptide (TPR) repeat protein
MRSSVLFVILLLQIFNAGSSQTKSLDSLKQIIAHPDHDTSLVHAYYRLGEKIYLDQPDSATVLWKKAIGLCEAKLSEKSSPLQKFYRRYEGFLYTSLGAILENKGDQSGPLNYHFQSLKIAEQLGNKEGLASVYSNIGIVYESLEDLEKAIEYYSKAMSHYRSIGKKAGMALCYNNIANAYMKQDKIEEATELFEKSIQLHRETGDISGLAYSLNNLGALYNNVFDNFPKALDYFEQSLKLHEQRNDKRGIVYALMNIGNVYYKQKKYDKARNFLSRSLEISYTTEYPEIIRDAAQEMFYLGKATKNGKEALEMFRLFITMRDSINNQETRKAGIQKQIQYEYDKKAVADSIRNAEKNIQENIKREQEIKQRRAYSYGGLIAFVLMLVIALISFRAFKNKQKANEIISLQKKLVDEQKHMIEEKQKEIIDSITYARRIQRSLLPSGRQIERALGKLNQTKRQI